MAETNQTGVFAATTVYSVMCFLFLVTQGPLEEFCCLATFLDLSLSPLAALPPPPRSPSFSVRHRHSSSQSSFSIPACGSRSHFHVSGTPISVTLSCLLVSLENSQPSLGSSRKANSDFSIPRTVRSALLTLVIQIIIWLYLTAIHTLVPIPLLPMLCHCTHFVF